MKKIFVGSTIVFFTQVTLSLAQSENDNQLIESILGTLDKTIVREIETPASTNFETPVDTLDVEPDNASQSNNEFIEKKRLFKWKEQTTEEKKPSIQNEQKEKVRLQEKEQRYRELDQKKERLLREKEINIAKKERTKAINPTWLFLHKNLVFSPFLIQY